MIMKLSNIFLSTLVVLLCCTACSKDDESFKGKDADASLSIAVKVAGSAVTKGFHPNDENELAGEAKVNNLSVLVFDESGAQLIGYGWQATNSEGEASILNVPAMTMRAQIVIVSNTPENSLAGVTSYSDFESKLAQLADQSQSNLVMSSPVITTQAPLVKGDNYLGYARWAVRTSTVSPNQSKSPVLPPVSTWSMSRPILQKHSCATVR